MDLDDFDVAVEQALLETIPSESLSPKDAVGLIDAQWYTSVSRRGRWMDLIGDYAGSEPFVVDGEALLQVVLNDPLLALGRTDDVSFQIVHVIYAMERVLHEILIRSVSFEIVFWHDQRYLTLQYGEDGYASSSRSLARTILFSHLKSLDIPVHTFLDASDPAWLSYQMHTKPMVIMTNDGGIVEGATTTAHVEWILLQHVFIYTVLAQGVSVTLVKGAQYRDSKIMSFVYEQRVCGDLKSRFQHGFWLAVHDALQSQTAQESNLHAGATSIPLESVESLPAHELAVNLVRNLSDSSTSQHEFFLELLQLFVAHILYVPLLGLKERARPPVSLPADLLKHVNTSFLPVAFFNIEKGASAVTVDGRIFAELLDYILRDEQLSLSSVLGVEVATAVEAIWIQYKLRVPNSVLASLPPVVCRMRPRIVL
ncbi:hypothetical protein TRAPUB_14238 [Trametes pubescens]|uniref:ATP-dependent RNA helicase DDX60 PIN-like domain-containing protein n=1 Tax=Trametes pubescens TaxID=154538 RepID=A0A1M2VNY1_TRAPU|nr:hypothetical protein TRAPUB_14238 [Trametes pubescens]